MADEDHRRADPFALAALWVSLLSFVISLVGGAITVVNYVDYSEVELLPLEQVVIVLDDRRENRYQTLVAPEISAFNRASGAYSDAIKNASLTITTSSGEQFCFEDMSYSRLRIDGVAIGARLSRATSDVAPVTDEVAPAGGVAQPPCEEVECIRQGLGNEFLLVTLDDAIPQTLNAGAVFSGRIAFKPRVCPNGGEIPSYEDMLNAMLGTTVTVEVELETLKDGVHATSCTTEFGEREHAFAIRERFIARSCTPLGARPRTFFDRLRAWIDAQI
jgi:hypothetical protein